MTDTVKRVMLPRLDPRLDRLIVHDERSRDFPFKLDQPIQRESKRHYSHIGIMNQRNLGGCVGFSSTKCMSHTPFYRQVSGQLRKGHYHDNNQFARSVYSDCTHVDEWAGEWPPMDTGSSGLAAGKVFLGRDDIGGYTHAFSPDDALDALSQQPWIMGIRWDNNMFNPDADGFITPGGGTAGGHELCVDEINVEDQYIEGPNSWSRHWGPLGGRFRMKWEVFADLMADDGDVTIFTPLSPFNLTVGQIQGSTLTQSTLS